MLKHASNEGTSRIFPAHPPYDGTAGKNRGLLPTLCFVKESRRKFLLPLACKKFRALDNDGKLKLKHARSSPLLRALIAKSVFPRLPRGRSTFSRKIRAGRSYPFVSWSNALIWMRFTPPKILSAGTPCAKAPLTNEGFALVFRGVKMSE